MITILVVDDQTLIRSAITTLATHSVGLTVVGEAGDGERAIELARRLRPDVVLMDIRMPGVEGIAATRTICTDPNLESVRVLILSTCEEDQSIVGALLTAGFATARGAADAASPDSSDVTSSVQSELTTSYSTAADTAQRYPQYSSQITAAAKSSFLDVANWADAAGSLAVLAGATLVFFMFPKYHAEEELLVTYLDADRTPATAAT